MQREKRLTKRERKAQQGTAAGQAAPRLAQARGPAAGGRAEHIHCVACGRHIAIEEFDDPATAVIVECAHRTSFPSCVGCQSETKARLDEHDRTGKAVRTAHAFH